MTGAKSSARLPLVVLVFALALETVHPVHVVRLVVSAVDEEAVWPQPLVGIKEEGNLCRPGASVDEVAVKQVIVLIGRETVQPEELHEIEVLA